MRFSTKLFDTNFLAVFDLRMACGETCLKYHSHFVLDRYKNAAVRSTGSPQGRHHG